MAYFGVDEQVRIEELCLGFKNFIRVNSKGYHGLRETLNAHDSK